MSTYSIVKLLHLSCAVLSVSLFALRLSLDAAGRSGWRRRFLRWIPHLNDTLLLGAAIGLLLIGEWNPLESHWLALKVLLLSGYIASGMIALQQGRPTWQRTAATACACTLVALIFYLAIQKPVFA